MKRGLVVGEIWATRKAIGLEGRQLKLVVEYPASAPGTPTAAELALAPLVVAVDILDVRSGQEVLVAYGSGARNVLTAGPDNRHELCDAAVAMLLEADVNEGVGDAGNDASNDAGNDAGNRGVTHPAPVDPLGPTQAHAETQRLKQSRP